MEKRYNYFYRVTNKANGKVYYGIHSSNKDPKKDNYLGSGMAIRRAVQVYGRENFFRDDLQFFDTRKELVEYEAQQVTKETVLNQETYNLTRGGANGPFRNEEQRSQALRESHKGKFWVWNRETNENTQINPQDFENYQQRGFVRGRRPWTEEQWKNILASRGKTWWVFRDQEETLIPDRKLQGYLENGWKLGRVPGRKTGRPSPMKGKHHTEESKRKRRLKIVGLVWVHKGDERYMVRPERLQEFLDSGFVKGSGYSPRKGVKLSPETIEKLRNRKLPPVSEETRRKLSAAKRGKKTGPLSEEHKRHLSESHKGIRRSPESIRKQQETVRRKKLERGLNGEGTGAEL